MVASPSSSRALQDEHWPSLQPCASDRPWRKAASRTVSSSSTSISMPTGSKRTQWLTLVPQPHTSFDANDMWTLDHVRGLTVQSPLVNLRNRTPEERQAYVEQYRKGFTIK